jgi:hypothetical protein
MRVTRLVLIERDIKCCYKECPYMKVEGAESLMVCEHPEAPEVNGRKGLIISHPDCIIGFPKECPLAKITPTRWDKKP